MGRARILSCIAMNSFLRRAALCLLMLFALDGRAADLKPWSAAQPPPFTLKDLTGREHRLADYRGKVVLVNFWATWCEPCRDEMPTIEKLKARFAERPFVVLAVNIDEPEARIRKFLSALPLSFPVLLDHERRLARAWNVRMLPSTYLIGPDGAIRFTAAGERDWNAREIADRIAELFPRKSR